MSDPLVEIARESRRQTAMIANIRAHVRIAAWCVAIWFVLSLPLFLVGYSVLVEMMSAFAKVEPDRPPSRPTVTRPASGLSR